MTRVSWKGRDITDLVTLVTVEHHMDAAGREALVNALYAPGDSRFALLNPACGDAVTISAGNQTLFSGSIERLSWDTDSLTLTMVCQEPSALLAKNEVYRAFSGTAKEITAALCRICGLGVGQLWDKPGTLWVPPSCGRTLFSVLKEVYGPRCITESDGDALTVRQAGTRSYRLHCDEALALDSDHSCDGLVTGAAIISARGSTLASAVQPQWEETFGLRRRVYALSGSSSQAQEQAKACLTPPAYTGRLLLPGDPLLPCGALVTPDRGDYGLAGEYLIRWVLHRLEAGVFTTEVGMVRT